VVLTVSLGVMKGQAASMAITFTPPLPQAKQDAIDRLGFGVENKAFLEFEARFWPNVPYDALIVPPSPLVLVPS
jgi:hypothetical protein